MTSTEQPPMNVQFRFTMLGTLGVSSCVSPLLAIYLQAVVNAFVWSCQVKLFSDWSTDGGKEQ